MKPSPRELKESHKLYAKLLDYLIKEGYAEDNDSADKLILGMSEEWYKTIIE